MRKNLFYIFFFFPVCVYSQNITIKQSNAEELKKLVVKDSLTLFYFWGTWCHPCIEKLSEIVKIAKESNTVNLIIVCDPLSKTKDILRFVKSSGYCDSSIYQLDKNYYNKSATKNIQKFTVEFCPSCANESGSYIFSGAYLYDKGGNLKFYNKSSLYIQELRELLKKSQ